MRDRDFVMEVPVVKDQSATAAASAGVVESPRAYCHLGNHSNSCTATIAMDIIHTARSREEEVFVPRKRFKASDLPLNSTQRSTIDSLLHTIKKKGEYDALRKKIWSEYAESVSINAIEHLRA